jgi:hypothetical protein
MMISMWKEPPASVMDVVQARIKTSADFVAVFAAEFVQMCGTLLHLGYVASQAATSSA